MRTFFLLWNQRVIPICQTASGELDCGEICQTVSAKSANPFTLSWSHYIELMGIKDPDERSFYEIESRQSNWDVRELRRQKASCLYERLALSRDKAGIKRPAKEGQMQMYMNYYDREVKLPDENPTIGLLALGSMHGCQQGMALT